MHVSLSLLLHFFFIACISTNIDSEGYFNISILSEADVSYIENRDTLFNVLRSTGGTWRSCVPTPIEVSV